MGLHPSPTGRFFLLTNQEELIIVHSEGGQAMKAIISAEVPQDLRDQAVEQAKREERSLSALIRLAILQYLEKEQGDKR